MRWTCPQCQSWSPYRRTLPKRLVTKAFLSSRIPHPVHRSEFQKWTAKEPCSFGSCMRTYSQCPSFLINKYLILKQSLNVTPANPWLIWLEVFRPEYFSEVKISTSLHNGNCFLNTSQKAAPPQPRLMLSCNLFWNAKKFIYRHTCVFWQSWHVRSLTARVWFYGEVVTCVSNLQKLDYMSWWQNT